uniref:Uncharacterized protein n=1 Tax=Rhizophora mucronata TaxID=61149 RepID=A0A2P2PJ43_RHIMU
MFPHHNCSNLDPKNVEKKKHTNPQNLNRPNNQEASFPHCNFNPNAKKIKSLKEKRTDLQLG